MCVGLPVGPISTTGSPGVEIGAQIGRAAHLEHDRRHQARRLSRRPAPVSARPSIGSRVAGSSPPRAGQGLEVLQAVELARLEPARRGGRLDDHFDDRRRQAPDLCTVGAPVAIRAGRGTPHRCRRLPGGFCAQHPRDDRETLLGRAQRLHDVAEVRRVQVAEDTRRSGRRRTRHQHLGALRACCSARFGLDRLAVLVARRESTCRRAGNARRPRARARCWAACRRR